MNEFEDQFFTEKEVAKFLGFGSIKTLQNHRSANADHPPFIKKGRIVRYPKGPFMEWYTSDLKGRKAS